MPIYNVVLHTSNRYKFTIEAKDSEEAGEKAQEEFDEMDSPNDVDDIEVELSDCQYTDQQELQDEERRYDEKMS
jgi:hypothetical protein